MFDIRVVAPGRGASAAPQPPAVGAAPAALPVTVPAPGEGGLDAAGRVAAAAGLAPGPPAIGLLAGVDPQALAEDERVVLLQGWERCARWVAAQQARAVVAVAGRVPAERDDHARELVRVALAGCGGSARGEVDVARALAGPLAAAGAALERGELSWEQARVLTQETALLDPVTAAGVAGTVLAAGAPSRVRGSVGEFRRRVRRAVIAADPVGAELAAQRAATGRRVARWVDRDGQAGLQVLGPALGVATIWTAVDVAAADPPAGDRRTLDQRRFDALVELCRAGTGAAPAGEPAAAAGTARVGAGVGRSPSRSGVRRGLRPTVFVYADAATWAGLADAPVELDGYGPIPAGAARECFTDAAWRAVVTEAVSGAVRSVSDTGYTPSARTRRHLLLRDRCCGFPGCGAAVWFCDADHNRPHAEGGCTDWDNCGLLCRRHHRLKTFTRWSWRRGPDGTLEWTDPHGQRWVRDPIRYLMPDPDPWPATEPEPAPAPATRPETKPPAGPATASATAPDTGPETAPAARPERGRATGPATATGARAVPPRARRPVDPGTAAEPGRAGEEARAASYDPADDPPPF